MKALNIFKFIFVCALFSRGLHAMGMSSMAAASGGASATGGGDEKKEEGNTVNVISQNAVESSGNQTQSFLDRLERRETIVKIRKTINVLSNKLKDIQVSVQNRLNQINASGK